MPNISNDEILDAGFEIQGEYVYGWRTRLSSCSETTYEPGKVYVASLFSTCKHTDCHPGIYLAPLEWMKFNYGIVDLVRCRCKRSNLFNAGDKWRCRKLEIL